MDIRTKHTVAQDRLIVAEHRVVEAERRKSVNNIQLLSFEQKQLEKRLSVLYSKYHTTSIDRPLNMRGRSTSEIILRNVRRSSSWADLFPIQHSKFSISLHDSKQNLLTLPKLTDPFRRFSAYSDGDMTENVLFQLRSDSPDEEENHSRSNPKLNTLERLPIIKQRSPKTINQPTKALPPIVAVIPPEEDILFLRQ